MGNFLVVENRAPGLGRVDVSRLGFVKWTPKRRRPTAGRASNKTMKLKKRGWASAIQKQNAEAQQAGFFVSETWLGFEVAEPGFVL